MLPHYKWLKPSKFIPKGINQTAIFSSEALRFTSMVPRGMIILNQKGARHYHGPQTADYRQAKLTLRWFQSMDGTHRIIYNADKFPVNSHS